MTFVQVFVYIIWSVFFFKTGNLNVVYRIFVYKCFPSTVIFILYHIKS